MKRKHALYSFLTMNISKVYSIYVTAYKKVNKSSHKHTMRSSNDLYVLITTLVISDQLESYAFLKIQEGYRN